MERRDFRNGVAFVTGGSGGLGASICRSLAKAGVDVALTFNRNERAASELVEELKMDGVRALPLQVDLSDLGSVQSAIARTASELGEPSTVISAAGPQLHFRYMSNIEPDLFHKTMRQDVDGFYNLVASALPILRAQRGALVALATPAIQKYTKKDILSIAPKAAVHAIVKGIAVEEGRFGVRANSVGVGLVGDAGLFDSLKENGSIDDKFMKATFERVPLARLGKSSEIAEAVLFLASEKASFVTGNILMADGGLSA